MLMLMLDAEPVSVSSLSEARTKVAAFIRERGIAAADYGDSTGRIARDGVPYCRVSFHGRLWMLDVQGRETYRAMNDRGEVSP